MNRRKPPKGNDFHEEMLRHLAENPPPSESVKPPGRTAKSKPPKRPTAPPRGRDRLPALMLRGLTVEAALDRLERFLRQHHRHGTRELLLIVGKGSRSPSGESILAPEIREFCAARPALVRGIREAPEDQGGSGAWIVELENG